jgi:hypothetical protein
MTTFEKGYQIRWPFFMRVIIDVNQFQPTIDIETIRLLIGFSYSNTLEKMKQNKCVLFW